MGEFAHGDIEDASRMGETEAETMSTGTMEGSLDSVSSQVSEAFGKLTHLQEELRVRLQTVAERERSAEETAGALDELAKRLETREQELRDHGAQLDARSGELDRRAAEVEESRRQHEAQSAESEAALREREARCDDRCARLDEREASLRRRQDVVDAFQEMLAQMHAALETLEPESIMAALDAGAAYEDCAKNARTGENESRSDEEELPAKDPIGLTPEEQARFFALRNAGKNDAEILAEIYAARTAASNGSSNQPG